MAVALVCVLGSLAGSQSPLAIDGGPTAELGALAREIERLAASVDRLAARAPSRAVPAAIERKAVVTPVVGSTTPLDAAGIVEQLRGLRQDLRRLGEKASIGDSQLRHGTTRLDSVQAFIDACRREDAHNSLQLLYAEEMLSRFGRPTRASVNQAGAMFWRYEDGRGQDAAFEVTFYDGVVMDVGAYVRD